MVTANQKSIIDIHTRKKKEPKQNTKDSHQITKEQKRKKRPTKAKTKKDLQKPKQLTKWQ